MSAGDRQERHDAAERPEPSSSSRIWLEVAILASTAGADVRPIGARGNAALWTVLIVASDADMRAYVRECLAEARLWLVAAADLGSGVAALAGARPSLLVLDEAAFGTLDPDAALHDELKDVPVLLLAADAPTVAPTTRPEDSAHATILAGPFNARRLREAVARCLSRVMGR